MKGHDDTRKRAIATESDTCVCGGEKMVLWHYVNQTWFVLLQNDIASDSVGHPNKFL